MKKLLTILFSVLLTANFLGCGGGGGGSTSTGTTGKTKVTINLGETKTVSNGLLNRTSSIPAAIASIKFTISAPDMATMVRVLTVSGSTSISETFEVPTGSNRLFLVEALDSDGNILFQGSTYADLTGASADLTIAMISVEDIAPVFSGLTVIDSVTTTSMVLSWSPATDNVTPSGRIQYLIYISMKPGGQNFTNPNFVTAIGAASYNITGLNPDTAYYIVVRAMDEMGNSDANNEEKSAKTLMSPDVTPPGFGGIVEAIASSETAISLSWNPASDDRTSVSDITYLIYMATSSGGQNLAIPSYTRTGTTYGTVTGLNQGTTYYFIVRAKDEAGNIDNNTVEKSATTLDYVTIEGHVYEQYTLNAIQGAVVSTSLDSQTATTDADGYFFLQTNTLANYCCTPYTITITAAGYTTFSQSSIWGDHPSDVFYLWAN
ncbi:MAG: fibronectin type III domain-containing protein [Nitrospirae bacterium]|nr:fibronectin type III domain-containing protein [Nitrospirota bacterium]